MPHVDDYRLPSVTSLDGRVEKKFMFGVAKIALDFDVFNVLNSGTVLGQQYDTRLTGPTGIRKHARNHEPAHRASRRPLHLLSSKVERTLSQTSTTSTVGATVLFGLRRTPS